MKLLEFANFKDYLLETLDWMTKGLMNLESKSRLIAF